jgi:hypothetical protein
MFEAAAPLAIDYSSKGDGAVLVRLPNGLSYEVFAESYFYVKFSKYNYMKGFD